MHELVDTDRYPVNRLNSPEGADLVTRCAQELWERSALTLPGFLRREIVESLIQEVNCLKTKGHRMSGEFSPYSDNLSEGDNNHLPADHPRRLKLPASHRFVAGDLVPSDSPMRRLYEDPGFQDFVARVLREDSVYPVDAMASINYLVYEPGDSNGWHFDTTKYVISLLLQSPDAGGDYEYVPDLRSETDENFEGVNRRMQNPDDPEGVESAELAPGTLFFFRGLNTFHRVKPVEGERDRMVVIISYHNQPGHETSDGSKMAMYGRVD